MRYHHHQRVSSRSRFFAGPHVCRLFTAFTMFKSYHPCSDNLQQIIYIRLFTADYLHQIIYNRLFTSDYQPQVEQIIYSLHSGKFADWPQATFYHTPVTNTSFLNNLCLFLIVFIILVVEIIMTMTMMIIMTTFYRGGGTFCWGVCPH